MTIEQILEAIEQMKVTELNELVKAAEEKTEFDVVLANAGASKVKVIKVVREVTGLGLKEGVSKEEAEEMKAKLEETGATVEVK